MFSCSKFPVTSKNIKEGEGFGVNTQDNTKTEAIITGTPFKKIINCIKIYLLKTKMAFLSRILILLVILLHWQFINHTQISLLPNPQFSMLNSMLISHL